MELGALERIPRFWILHISGFLVFGAIVFVDVFPRFRDPAAVTYDATFVGSLFLGSLILRPVCRRILRRDTPWPRAMLEAALVAGLLGLPCGLLAEWSWDVVRGDPATWALLFSAWGAAVYGTFVLLSWSALYLGINHYQEFQMERERAARAEALAREATLQALRYQLDSSGFIKYRHSFDFSSALLLWNRHFVLFRTFRVFVG